METRSFCWASAARKCQPLGTNDGSTTSTAIVSRRSVLRVRRRRDLGRSRGPAVELAHAAGHDLAGAAAVCPGLRLVDARARGGHSASATTSGCRAAAQGRRAALEPSSVAGFVDGRSRRHAGARGRLSDVRALEGRGVLPARGTGSTRRRRPIGVESSSAGAIASGRCAFRRGSPSDWCGMRGWSMPPRKSWSTRRSAACNTTGPMMFVSRSALASARRGAVPSRPTFTVCAIGDRATAED